MAKVITITNNKGGVGKTTAAVSLAGFFAQWGLRVAIIDTDPQGNIVGRFGLDKHSFRKNMADVYLGEDIRKIAVPINMQKIVKKFNLNFPYENITLFPSNSRLRDIDTDVDDIELLSKSIDVLDLELLQDINGNNILDEYGAVQQKYHLIIVDTCPYIGYLMYSAMFASDITLIPANASNDSIAGISEIINEAEMINKKFKRKYLIRVFVNAYQKAHDIDTTNLERLQELVDSKLYDVYIPFNITIKQAAEAYVPVNVMNRINKSSSPGSAAYRALSELILEQLIPELFVIEDKEKGGEI